MTLEDRLERLSRRTPPGDPAEVLATARSRAAAQGGSRNPLLPAAAAAAVAVLAMVGAAFALTSSDETDSVTAGPGTADIESRLVVPESGASPQWLADGTPVWAVRHEDGSVSVLDAVSAHRPFGAGTLVGWCESTRTFVDPMYGSRFDERGLTDAGPAPLSLSSYRVTSVADGTATVTGPPDERPRPADDGPNPSDPSAVACLDLTGGPVSTYLPGSYVLHPYDTQTPMTPEEAVRQPDGTYVLVDARVVLVDGEQPVVCTSPVEGGSTPACEGVPAPGLTPHDRTATVVRGPFIARPQGGTLTDIAYVGEHTVVYGSPDGTHGEAAVWDVDPAGPPAPSATRVAVLVTRLGCSGGETGKVLEPAVTADDERVVVTFWVEPLPDDAYPCPGNDSVPYVVELGEPLGDRELVDGACQSGDAVSTSFCSDGAVRWSPPA